MVKKIDTGELIINLLPMREQGRQNQKNKKKRLLQPNNTCRILHPLRVRFTPTKEAKNLPNHLKLDS